MIFRKRRALNDHGGPSTTGETGRPARPESAAMDDRSERTALNAGG